MEMVNWKEVLTIQNGKNQKKVQSSDGKYPIYGSGGEMGRANDFLCPKGTTIIGRKGSINNPIFVNERFWNVDTAFGLIAGEKLDKKYLYYFCKTYNFLKHNKATTLPSLTKLDLLNIKMPLPSIEAQKHIAQILDDAAALRDKTKQLLNEYDALAQSIFLDMFGDPVTNPKGWDVRKLKDMTTKIVSGNTPKGGSKVYVENGITFFRSQNVWRNRIDLEDVAFIDNKTHQKMERSSLKSKDILMTKTGRVNTENSSLGRAAMYKGEDDKANINGHVYLIRPSENAVHEFILFILTTRQYREYIRRVCVGGIDKRQINKVHLENFPIINPPKKLKEEFKAVWLNIESQKELAKKELAEVEDLFNCLLQKTFKGELV